MGEVHGQKGVEIMKKNNQLLNLIVTPIEAYLIGLLISACRSHQKKCGCKACEFAYLAEVNMHYLEPKAVKLS